MYVPLGKALRRWVGYVVAAALAAGAAGCRGTQKAPAGEGAAIAAPAPDAAPGRTPPGAADDALPPPVESDLPESVRMLTDKPFTGDFDAMVKRRMIRVGVTYNRTFYFVDRGVTRGMAYEYGKLFEDELNKRLRTGNMRVHVVFVPMPRPMLASALLEGRVDAVIAQITVTPERQKLVDFSVPTRKSVHEVVVTAPGSPAIGSVEDLSGKEVYVRKGGTYHESLLALNQRFAAKGTPPVVVRFAADNLEDDDLLEMVNAGLMPATIVDSYLAEFWKKIFTAMTVHDSVAVRTGGELAVAFRKNSPKFQAELNAFLARNGIGSAFGNMMEKRYFVNTTFAKNATSEAERKKLVALITLFRTYSERYGMDPLLMAAQGFQESGLDQAAKSPVGAIGIMQVMPATGAELKVGDISQMEANIHAGVKYIRFMIDKYFKDEPMDPLNKGLFAFASYNAGPNRIRQLRQEAARRGLDPNVWFGQVEQVASERIGRETVTYVSNIYKYYVAYRLVFEEQQRRNAAKAQAKPASR